MAAVVGLRDEPIAPRRGVRHAEAQPSAVIDPAKTPQPMPTTIAASRKHLYAVNARFGTTDPQPAKYNVVRVP